MIDRENGSELRIKGWGWIDSPFIRAALWAAVVGYAIFAILSFFGTQVGEFDESIPLVGGMLVKRGLTPILDFYTVYAPLGLYVNAFVFGLLGRNSFAARLVHVVLYLLVLFLSGLFFRRQFPQSRPLVPAAMLVLEAAIGSSFDQPPWPGLSLALAGFLIYLSPVTGGRRLVRLAVSGAVIGVSLLFRLNFGAYVAAAVFLDLFLRRETLAGRLRFSPDFKGMAAFAIPIAACFSGFFALVYGSAAVTAVHSLLAIGSRVIAIHFMTLILTPRLVPTLMAPALWFSLRSLKSPRKAILAAALSLVFPVMAWAGSNHEWMPYVLVLMETALVLLLHFFVHPLERLELPILLFYCFGLHYYVSRMDWAHWYTVPISVALLLSFVVVHEPTEHPAPEPVGLGLALAVGVVMLAINSRGLKIPLAQTGAHLLAGVGDFVGSSETTMVADEVIPPSPEWVALYPDGDELDLVRYLRSRTSQDDAIFVGELDHSRVYVNDLQIYWLADRPVGVRTVQLEIGNATERDVQEEIIQDLERNHVKWVVLEILKQRGDRTYNQRNYQGSTLLDEYIHDHYGVESRFGRFAVLTAH